MAGRADRRRRQRRHPQVLPLPRRGQRPTRRRVHRSHTLPVAAAADVQDGQRRVGHLLRHRGGCGGGARRERAVHVAGGRERPPGAGVLRSRRHGPAVHARQRWHGRVVAVNARCRHLRQRAQGRGPLREPAGRRGQPSNRVLQRRVHEPRVRAGERRERRRVAGEARGDRRGGRGFRARGHGGLAAGGVLHQRHHQRRHQLAAVRGSHSG